MIPPRADDIDNRLPHQAPPVSGQAAPPRHEGTTARPRTVIDLREAPSDPLETDPRLRAFAGARRLVTAEDGGELCACAFALFIGHGSTLLGAVATDPRARGRGCASRLVKALAAEQNGRAAFVFCRSDGLEDFYKKCGFCRIGKWATARLHD